MEDKCRKCGGIMQVGKALSADRWKGSPDFIGDTGLERGCTMTLQPGIGDIVHCSKCADCGWSVR